MTVQELLVLIDTLYPNAESSAMKVSFMNLAQEDLTPYFGKVVEDATTLTVVDQDSYAYPTGITDINDIVAVGIGNQATPANRYDYIRYNLSKPEESPQVYYSYFEIINSTGEKKLCLFPAPSTVNLPILIRYKKSLTALSSTLLTASPDFNSNYHSMLAYYAASMICRVGASPDREQADGFMALYDAKLTEIWRKAMDDKIENRKESSDNPQWRARKSIVKGY